MLIMAIKKNKVKFVMDTDWLFDGIIDSEQKQYVLLGYFQKLNKNLEDMKLYPMFTELSLHLGNIQTLLNQNQILYTEKVLSSYDDELIISDLKVKNIPIMADDEYVEYQKILKYSHPKLQDYFGITKSIWSMAYDSIDVRIKKNRVNLESKTGFFYYKTKEELYVWRYSAKKGTKIEDQTKTILKLIYQGSDENLTINNIILNFLSTKEKVKTHKFPVFEVLCDEIFPLEETLVPIFKRKILSYILQTVKSEDKKNKKLLPNGVQ
jgi:hypothetical protein